MQQQHQKRMQWNRCSSTLTQHQQSRKTKGHRGIEAYDTGSNSKKVQKKSRGHRKKKKYAKDNELKALIEKRKVMDKKEKTIGRHQQKFFFFNIRDNTKDEETRKVQKSLVEFKGITKIASIKKEKKEDLDAIRGK